jgi:hypothetical protein
MDCDSDIVLLCDDVYVDIGFVFQRVAHSIYGVCIFTKAQRE